MRKVMTIASALLILLSVPFAFSDGVTYTQTLTFPSTDIILDGQGGNVSSAFPELDPGDFLGTWTVDNQTGSEDPWTDFHVEIQVPDGDGGFRPANSNDGISFSQSGIYGYVDLSTNQQYTSTVTASPPSSTSDPLIVTLGSTFSMTVFPNIANFYFIEPQIATSSVIDLQLPMSWSDNIAEIRLYGEPTFEPIQSPIPEPASGILMATGIIVLMLLGLSYRRKKGKVN